MKTIITAMAIAIVFAACNNTEKKNETTNPGSKEPMDHSGMAHADSSSGNMKKLMDKMMMEMHMLNPSGNNDVDFAATMLSHHKGAVEMAKLELAGGQDTGMKKFAQGVIDAQEKEISFMENFIAASAKKTSANAATFQEALNGSMKAMMNDQTPVYNNLDKDFAAQMIPHHQSAVDMAQVYLQYSDNEELKKLSRDIVDTQKKEIGYLKEWLDDHK